MAENTKVSRREQRPEIIKAAKQIDEIASGAMDIFNQGGGFAEEIAIATAVVDMRALLTPEIMAPVMALMNTDLGFRSDRDPKVRQKDGTFPTPYSVDVVREVFIESRLRGFHLCGNEFNIISGRFYGCKAGFERKVREATDGTFEASYDPPTIMGDTAKVKARAKWIINGKPGDIGIRQDDPCELSVKINAFMGADGAIGKAERKLCKRVWQRISGQIVPDGDIETEATIVQPESGPGEPVTFDKVPKYEPEPPANAQDLADALARTKAEQERAKAQPPVTLVVHSDTAELEKEVRSQSGKKIVENVIQMPEQAALAPQDEAAPPLKLASELEKATEKPPEKKPAKAKTGKTPTLPGESYNYVRWFKGVCNLSGANIDDVISFMKMNDQCDDIYQTVEEINEHQPKSLHWAYLNWTDLILPELTALGKIEQSPS